MALVGLGSAVVIAGLRVTLPARFAVRGAALARPVHRDARARPDHRDGGRRRGGQGADRQRRLRLAPAADRADQHRRRRSPRSRPARLWLVHGAQGPIARIPANQLPAYVQGRGARRRPTAVAAALHRAPGRQHRLQHRQRRRRDHRRRRHPPAGRRRPARWTRWSANCSPATAATRLAAAGRDGRRLRAGLLGHPAEPAAQPRRRGRPVPAVGDQDQRRDLRPVVGERQRRPADRAERQGRPAADHLPVRRRRSGARHRAGLLAGRRRGGEHPGRLVRPRTGAGRAGRVRPGGPGSTGRACPPSRRPPGCRPGSCRPAAAP